MRLAQQWSVQKRPVADQVNSKESWTMEFQSWECSVGGEAHEPQWAKTALKNSALTFCVVRGAANCQDRQDDHLERRTLSESGTALNFDESVGNPSCPCCYSVGDFGSVRSAGVARRHDVSERHQSLMRKGILSALSEQNCLTNWKAKMVTTGPRRAQRGYSSSPPVLENPETLTLRSELDVLGL